MVLVVQLIEKEYWVIVSLGTNEKDYTLSDGQKFIHTETWVEGKSVNDLVWDDKDKQVIIYPEHLKITQYKKQVLAELAKKFSDGSTDLSIGEQTLSNIVAEIKTAETVAEIDSARAKIKEEKNKFLKRIGLDG